MRFRTKMHNLNSLISNTIHIKKVKPDFLKVELSQPLPYDSLTQN
jgi:hypothetical protein